MLIAIVIGCTLCEALFTALEVALGAVPRARLRELLEEATGGADAAATDGASGMGGASGTGGASGPGGAGGPGGAATDFAHYRIFTQAQRVTLMFITVTSLTLWTATALLTWQARAGQWPAWALPGALVAVIFVAEVLPLLVAARNPEMVALRGLKITEYSLAGLLPLIVLLGGLGAAFARALGANPRATTGVTETELRSALATAEEEGVIESEERAMLEGAMDFRDKEVSEVMTPRVDIVAVSASAGAREILEVAMREGHSRLPAYEGSIDKIIGIVSTKDLLPHLRARESSITARDIARGAHFMPQHKLIAAALDELRGQRTLMAIIVDANGGTEGLITLEDLLEELVGEIQDEYDREEPAIRVAEAPSGLHAVDCAASVTLRDFEKFWRRQFRAAPAIVDGDSLPADLSLSMAALALHHFDSVPKAGDRVVIGQVAKVSNAAEHILELIVGNMDGPRIEEVRVQESAPHDTL